MYKSEFARRRESGCDSPKANQKFFIGEESMKKTFKKVLSTVVASLFVLQSAALAAVSVGAVDANVLKYTPTIDGVLDNAYLNSAKVDLDTSKVAGMGTSPNLKGTAYYLWDGGYLYMAAEITGDPKLEATGNSPWTDSAAFTFFKKGEEQVEAGRIVVEPMEGTFQFSNTNGTACGSNLPAVGTTAKISDYSSEVAYTADTVKGTYIVEARMKFDSAAAGTQYSINFGALDGQNYAVIGDWGWAGPVGGTLTLSSEEYIDAPTTVAKYTPELDGVKDKAYDASISHAVEGVTYNFLYDDSYIYLYAEGTMTVDATSYLNITFTGTPVNAGVITSEGINFIIQPFHNPTSGVVGNVQTWQAIGGGQANMGSNLAKDASAATEFKITVDGGKFTAEVRVANATALDKVVAFANGVYNAGTLTAGEGDYWKFWGDGSAPKYTALTLGEAYNPGHTHTFEDEFTVDEAATCLKVGSKSRHCVDFDTCGGKTDVTEIPVIDHNIENGVCTMCGMLLIQRGTPTIDGVVDAAYATTGSNTVNSGTVKFLWDDNYIYAIVTTKETDAKVTVESISDLWGHTIGMGIDFASRTLTPASDDWTYITLNNKGTFAQNLYLKDKLVGVEGVDYAFGSDADTNIFEIKIATDTAFLDQNDYVVGFGSGACDENLWKWNGTIYNGGDAAKGTGLKTLFAHAASCDKVFSADYTVVVAPTCTEVGYKARLCACGVTTDVTTVPALGHTFVNGKCSVCGTIEVAVPNTSVPYVTAAVDGVKDAAYDSGVKYYVNGATAYLLYDKDYFYVYVEADEGENVTYFTLGNPDKTDTVGPFWSHTASVKFDFNAKNVTTKGWEYGVFNQNGQSTFADNISVDGGDTCLAKAGTDYVFADGAKAAELKIHIGEGYATNNYAGRAYVGSTIYSIGFGTETDGINLTGGALHAQVINGKCTPLTLARCLNGCTAAEARVVITEPTCHSVGTSAEVCAVCGGIIEGSEQEIAMTEHNWAYEIDVAPTCTTEGSASMRSCTNEGCSEVQVGDYVIPAKGHSYVYSCAANQTQNSFRKGHIGKCSVCGDVTETIAHTPNELGICSECGGNVKLLVSSYSVSLADVLNLNIKVDTANFEGYDSFFVKFVEHFSDGSDDLVTTISNYTTEGSRYVFSYGAPPQRAVNNIDVYVCGVKNGETYTGSYRTFNIKDYIYLQLNKTNVETALKTVYVHLLDYITEAQRVVNYNLDNLANAALTDEMTALRLPENKVYTNIAGTTVNEGASGATYKSRSLYCADAVSFKYNFTLDNAQYTTDNVKVVVTYKDDGVVMAEYTGNQITYDETTGRYTVVVGLIAQNMSKAFELNVYTLDGTLITGKTLTNSIESQVATNKDTTITAMLDAMMQYGRAAAKLVG